ncbi:MAG TPA: glutathione S-transferase family protein [Vitreimonas sp.]|uniref:glutathione S-transferase family protein n=1 Tax=Vitreimonas sp. TaxID=3069702 RepID=UPI002D591294|nr:glutathione S-transferase family protein [Vitreimonas sp.]HYD87611.1 glutathione S-transferase family protein [Vitreimonas sp.]
MTITITAFADSPDRGGGYARDMIVRWALEEVGQPYEVRLVPWADFKKPAHRARQPFGQIPTYEEGDLVLFESGAIVLHIAERFSGLFPADANARARAIAWMFAAVSSVEPLIVQREVVEYLESDKSWAGERMAMVEQRIRDRLGELSARLGDAEWLDGDFSAADILMVQALRRLEGSDLLAAFANLAAYVERGKARPAFKRAFAAQLAVFTGQNPLPREGERAG